MNHFKTLTRAIVLAVSLGIPATLAAGPGGTYSTPTTMDGTVKLINLQQGMIQLNDGTEVHTADYQLLQTLKPGDRVHVTYEDRNGRYWVLRIEPVKQ